MTTAVRQPITAAPTGPALPTPQPDPTAMPHSPEDLPRRLAEAGRYALLRRLAPALRHDMAGSLQPISMMAAMLEKRLLKPDPDLPALAKNGGAISTLAREASGTCMDLMTWLAPKENQQLAVAAGIADAIGVIGTELSFRGFALDNRTSEALAELPRSVFRGVWMAALFALTDAGEGPASVRLDASADADGEVLLTIALAPADGEVFATGNLAYRLLEWADVEAIAHAESVALAWSADKVELRCRAAEPVSPIRM